MSDHECIIGMTWQETLDSTELVTAAQLEQQAADGAQHRLDMREYSQKIGLGHLGAGIMPHLFKPYPTAAQLTDRRSGYGTWFDYCPTCGAKIDWRTLRAGWRKDGGE